MIFNSITFFVFVAIVLPIYFSLRGRAQLAFTLAASYVFYGWWDWRYLGLIIGSTLVNYFLALGIDRSDTQPRRKAIMLLGLAFNLGLLGFFKYYNFFIESFRELAAQFGYTPPAATLEIILPIGISFFTFQELSYVIDVYWREIRAERSLLRLATAIAFFPHLVAGPIIRASFFLPQLYRNHRFNRVRAIDGAAQMAFGFFKKVVVADSLSLVVDTIFQEPSVHTSIGLITGVVFYAFQIYCDFSGYSDIAIGLARVMGYRFPVNFRRPYVSQSFSEFWTRWHVSLSSWLRDYLYIPLGGSRNGKLHTYRNLMLTMLIGGLWHGADWKFVLWGGLHGLYLVLQRMLSWIASQLFPSVTAPKWLKTPLLIALVFTLTCVAWIPFRAESLSQAIEIMQRILQFDNLNPRTIRNPTNVGRGAAAICILLAVEMINGRYPLRVQIVRRPVFAAFLFAAALWVIALLGTFGNQQFIYFQF